MLTYNWDIIGHQKQLVQLERDIAENKVAHAYLFSGPIQTGKHRVARTFAAILQCPNGYCRTCQDCHLMQSRCHPDAIFLDDQGETIRIDDVRALIQKANLSAQGKYRIILIENIERMPIEAQNSFLKTLEEPPGRTLFLLTTSQPSGVLPTIQSRTRNLHFAGLDDTTLAQYLKEKYGQLTTHDDIIALSQGRPGMTISLAAHPDLLEEQRQLYRDIEKILTQNNLHHKMALVDTIEKEADKIDQFLDAFTRYLRKLLHDYLDQGAAHPLYDRFTFAHLMDLYDTLQETSMLLERNINKRLVLENFMIKTEV